MSSKEYYKEYYKTNKEHHAALERKRLDTPNGRFSRWKKSAKGRGINWNLAAVEILKRPLICFYTGKSLTWKANELNTVSLDRLDSSRGYEPDNVVFCMKHINFAKGELTVSEFVDLCKSVSAHL